MSPVLQQKRQFLRLFSFNEWQQRDILLAGSESKLIPFVTTGSFLGSRQQKQQFSKHAARFISSSSDSCVGAKITLPCSPEGQIIMGEMDAEPQRK